MTDNSNQPEQEGTTPTKPQSRRSLRIVLIIVGLAVLLGGIWWYYRHVTYGQYMQTTDNAYVAADSVVISSKVAGYVEEVFVGENEQVARGGALVQLDLRDYQAQAQQARAQIAATLAGADTIRSQVAEQDAAIRQIAAMPWAIPHVYHQAEAKPVLRSQQHYRSKEFLPERSTVKR